MLATGLPERNQRNWLSSGLVYSALTLTKQLRRWNKKELHSRWKRNLIFSTAFQDLSRGYASLLERYLYKGPHPALKRWNFHNPVINKQYPPIISEDYPAIVSHKWNANSYTRSEWLECTQQEHREMQQNSKSKRSILFDLQLSIHPFPPSWSYCPCLWSTGMTGMQWCHLWPLWNMSSTGLGTLFS